MNILIVKNVTKEGPGTIEDFLKGKGIKLKRRFLTYGILPILSLWEDP
jgi:hypothetical protein